jgi:hypothetical protein
MTDTPHYDPKWPKLKPHQFKPEVKQLRQNNRLVKLRSRRV